MKVIFIFIYTSVVLTSSLAWAADDRFRTVVTAARGEQAQRDAEVAVDVIDRQAIEASGARDVADVLDQQAGVQVDRSFAGAGVLLQGLDPRYVLILVDGQRVAGRVNGVVDLSRFPVERIERIEIVRGASSALYGSDAIAGVINIITRRQHRRLTGEAQSQYGSLGALDLRGRLGLRRGALSGSVTAGFHRRDAFSLQPDTEVTSGSAFAQYGAALRMDYEPDRRLQVTADVEYQQRRTAGVDQGGGGALFDRQNRTETLLSQLSATLRLPNDQLRVGLSYSHFRDQYLLDQRGSTAMDEYQQTREHLLRGELQFDHDSPLGHRVSLGGEVLYERLTADRLVAGTGDRVRGGLFLQDRIRLDDRGKLSLAPALRLDYDSQFGHNLSPKAALRYTPLSALTLRLSYGVGYRAPGFKDLLLRFENPGAGYVVDGNPLLRPEVGRNLNASIDVQVERFDAAINAYRNDIDDLITPVASAPSAGQVGQRFTYQNIESAYTQGVEVTVRVSPIRALQLQGSYTLTDSRDRASDRPLPGRALHRGTVNLSGQVARLGLSATARCAIVGERLFYVADGEAERTETSPPYALLDARASWSWRRLFSLFVGADNLAGAGDQSYLLIAPRTFYGGVSALY